MSRFLVVSAFVFALVAFETAGEVVLDPKIYGSIASAGQFPWQVAIRSKRGRGVIVCGGSLIDPQWVLTAAHCLTRATTFSLEIGVITINAREAGADSLVSTEKIMHEKYNLKNANNDIALIRLPSKVELNERVQPVKLAKKGSVIEVGEIVTVSGWSGTGDTSRTMEVLKYYNLTVISNSECGRVYENNYVGDFVFCTRDPLTSTCGGDSGGPVVRYDESGEATQIGIVSFGRHDECEEHLPIGYVRVEYYLKWISKKTGITFD